MTFDEWLAAYVKAGNSVSPAHMAAMAWEAARAEEAAFNLVQLQATSNRMLNRGHLIFCAVSRLRELDPDSQLLPQSGKE